MDTRYTFYIDKPTRRQMKSHDDVNWAAVMRNAVNHKLAELRQLKAQENKA